MATVETTVSIKNFTRHPVPRFPYATVARAAIPGWEISLVFVGETRARSLNRKLRGKSYVPNVLSYKVGPRSGEIIICPQVSRREARLYDHSASVHLLYLFIHGLGHLAGRAHGATMEQWEHHLLARFTRAMFKGHGSTHRNRH